MANTKVLPLIVLLFSSPISYLYQDQQSKVQVVNKWIQEHKHMAIKELASEDPHEEGEVCPALSSPQPPASPQAKPCNIKEELVAREEEQINIVETEKMVKPDQTYRFKKKIKFAFKNKNSLRKLRESNGSVKALESFPSADREEVSRQKLLYKGFRDLSHNYCVSSIKTSLPHQLSSTTIFLK